MAVAIVPEPPEADAKPFLKWVGGKRQLLPHLIPRAPKADDIGTYYEPFLGGGALFFHLRPARAVLSDSNVRLIRAYSGLRDDPDGVIDRLKAYRHHHGKPFFLKMRSLDVDAQTDAGVAAWLIYLNRTAYNGLYRVNSKNLFNVPFGDYKKPLICDEENLRACSRVLKRAGKIEVRDFSQVLNEARSGDFVYFDPPYAPLTSTSKFTDYTSGGFGDKDQIRLRDVALELKNKGVRVLLSNSSARRVSKWYEDFDSISVGARRSVNCKPGSRGPVQELLIY
ncbi:MAG TPA: DNA adenine methylase [Polyangia bacterium]|nr:DNA adenine methylase [Polyangia bacterium]